jgi:hypothetical protein
LEAVSQKSRREGIGNTVIREMMEVGKKKHPRKNRTETVTMVWTREKNGEL